MRIKKEKLLVKPEGLKPTSSRFEILGVLNPAAIRDKKGNVVLFIRVIERLKKFEDEKYYYSPRCIGRKNFKIKVDRFSKKKISDGDEFGFVFKNGTKRLTFISHLRKVVLSKKGFRILSISRKPSFYGVNSDSELGVEDPRIVCLNDKYYMTYVGLSRKSDISTHLAVSDDLKTWKRLGIIFGEQDKDVVLFPERVKGNYVSFDRPEGNFSFSTPHIWVAYSKDLIHWGKLKSFDVGVGKGIFERSGAGPPPLKIRNGWLFIFHGVTRMHLEGFVHNLKKSLGMEVAQGPDVYAVWAAVLDEKNPEKVLSVSHYPIIAPRKKYEISFEGKRVVFPTGMVFSEDKKSVLLYCGAGDKNVIVKKISIREILKNMVKK